MRVRSGIRARWSLLAAGGLVALTALLLTGAAEVLGLAPPAGVVAAVVVGSLLGALVAGEFAAARRAATPVLVRAAATAAVGLAAVLGLATVLLVLGRLPAGTERGLVGPLLVGIVVAAAATRPLARRAVRAVWAALRGTWSSPDELLAAFADTTRADVDDLLRRLAEALRREHRLAVVEIWSASPGGDGLRRTVAVPESGAAPAPLDGDELALLARSGVAGPGWLRLWLPRLLAGRAPDSQLRLAPAVHAGRVLALLVTERAADGDAVLGAEERALGEVAARLAVVLHNRQLDEALAGTLADLRHANTELQASRARLVSTADAERRRLERDLHDGAQQHLVALAVGLRLVRDGVQDRAGEGDGAGNGAAADLELLDELDRGVREAITALRDLAHGIYPPLLRDAGLPDALRAAAARSPLAAQVVVGGDVGRHPEEVEAALYFCGLEAMANAAKHAPGAALTVTIGIRGGALVVEIADTGPGFDPLTCGPGAGRQNMADRLGAVGGTVRWDAAAGRGTTVTGTVPVDGPQAARDEPVGSVAWGP